MNVCWLAAVLCGLLTIEHAWSRDHATSSVTSFATAGPTLCNSLPEQTGSWTSPLDNSNDH